MDSAARVFLQTFQTDGLEVTVHVRDAGCRGDRLLFADLSQGLIDRVSVKRRPASQQFVENGPQPVDVGRGRDLGMMAGDLLGGHVRRSAQDETGLGQTAVGVDALGEPEIGDMRRAMFVEQNVRGFEVAVQDAAEVGVVDGQGDFLDQPGDGSRVVPEPRHVALEVPAGDQLEAQKGQPPCSPIS